MQLRSVLILVIALVGLGTNSCSEEDQTTRDQLIGRWELVEASRNGKPTQSLDGLYFVFEAEGEMETNLNMQAERGEFELADDNIRQIGTSIEPNYRIESISDSTMRLYTRLRNVQFRFDLVKNPNGTF